jgi:hypothetical protein
MPLPTPEPGLVISYEFLWSHEYAAGDEHGEKRRPCAIILAIRTSEGQTSVTVAPMTHRQPDVAAEGIEIPSRVKASLGLDARRSWIIIAELNEFVWPGLDLCPVPGGRPDQYDYGFLPPVLFDQIRAAILALDEAMKRVMYRSE